jgi:DNA-binding transcriptional MerR regulator
MEKILPLIPAKRYFTISEVGDLCGVKPHVLRYWEQEFTQLRPVKRRGNRRYYQHHEVLMIRRIRSLLYDQGFTISGARNKMQESLNGGLTINHSETPLVPGLYAIEKDHGSGNLVDESMSRDETPTLDTPLHLFRRELFEIREILTIS